MKKTILLLLLFSSLLTFAQDIVKIDSLKAHLIQAKDSAWVNVALELVSQIHYQDKDYSEELIDDVIEYSKSINYSTGLGKAFQIKASFLIDDNKNLSGVTYYQKSFEIFSNKNFHHESAISLYGVASGLSRIHRIEESQDTLQYALSHYYDSIQPSTLSEIYHLMSNNYKGIGEIELAIKCVDTAINIEEANKLDRKLANSYNALGIYYSDLSDFKNSLYYYDLCEKISTKIKDTLLMSYAIHNKAIIYLDWGVYDESLNLFLQSQDLVTKAGYEYELVNSTSSIAAVYLEIKDYVKAKYYYNQALQMAEKHNDFSTRSLVLHNLGEILYHEKKYDSAMILLNMSLRYELEEGNTLSIAQSKNMIGSVYVALNKYNLAFKYFNEAEEVFEKFGSKQNLADLYLEYAKAHQKLKNDSLSIFYYQKGIEIATSINARNLMLEGYESSSLNFERMNLNQEALFYYKKFKQLNDSLYNKNASMRLDYMTLKLENHERQQALIQLANDQKVLKLESKNRFIYMTGILFIVILILGFFIWLYFLNKKSKKQLTTQYEVLLESEQKVKALLDASFDTTLLVNEYGTILTANNNDLFGFFPERNMLLNKGLFSFFTETNQKVLLKFFELVLSSKMPKEIQIHETNKAILNIKISPVIDIYGEVSSLAFYIKDVTQIEKNKEEKKKMELQLVQTQKMETIGTLAGGIAHDFNNYLATIKGYVSMALDDLTPENRLHKYLFNTSKAVTLAQDTVKKLLMFSRSNDIVFDKIYLHQLVYDSLDMVIGSKPKNVAMNHPEIPNNIELLADKNQLTQVILNICTNAFHAIGDQNGEVNIDIEIINNHADFDKKNIALIKISDNGMGMDLETQKRIFEPFFTTKDVGKGTGLGLSVVSGIIKQHNGKIEVHSEFGNGSIFSLFLPIIL